VLNSHPRREGHLGCAKAKAYVEKRHCLLSHKKKEDPGCISKYDVEAPEERAPAREASSPEKPSTRSQAARAHDKTVPFDREVSNPVEKETGTESVAWLVLLFEQGKKAVLP